MKPITDFKVDQSRFDGRGYVCAECRDKQRVKPGPTIRERRVQRAAGFAWCAGCHQWLPRTQIRAGVCQPCANRKMREHYASNPAFRAQRKGRALARKRGLQPIPPQAREAIMEEFDNCCAYCGTKATTFDHVVAFKKGGLTEPYNIVPACGPCNSSKRTQNVWAWLNKTGRKPHPQLFERLALYEAALRPPVGPDPFDL